MFLLFDVEKGANRGTVERIDFVAGRDSVEEGDCRRAIDAIREGASTCRDASISCDCRSSIALDAATMSIGSGPCLKVLVYRDSSEDGGACH
jgi:hypothetical protein